MEKATAGRSGVLVFDKSLCYSIWIMENLNIRIAADADFESIWRIFHDIVSAGDTYPFSPDTDRAAAYKIWMQTPMATYVAERDHHIVGTYYIKANMPGLGSHVCNAGYMVLKAAHSKGIGRAMCAHSLGEATGLGFKAMQYNLVVSTNAGAVRLWEQMGFKKIGHLPRAFDHCELGLVDAWGMYKSIAD